jgi:Tfp pilus assembly protein PilV
MPGHRRGERGTTLMELMIAAVLATVVAMFLAALTSALAQQGASVEQGTSDLTQAQLARGRLLIDAKAATSIVCGASDTFNVTIGVAPSATLIEYRRTGSNLIRWNSSTDSNIIVALQLRDIVCTDLGADGVEVTMTFGTEANPMRLFVAAAEVSAGP